MHAIIHFLAGLLAIYIFHISGTSAVVFMIATVFIDVDHVFEFRQMKRSLTKKQVANPLKFAEESNYSTRQQTLHIFHTFEIIALLYILAIYFPILIFVAHGFLFHLLFDAIGNVWNRNIKNAGTPHWYIYWFLTYYILIRSIHTK